MRTGDSAASFNLWGSLVLLPLILLAACSDQALSLFFDIPPPSEEEIAAAADTPPPTAEASVQTSPVSVEEDARRPAIEGIMDWREARKLLPVDREGRKGWVDWVKADHQGIIKPRGSIEGAERPDAFVFKYDFFIPGEQPADDAYFPHSTHTEWLACESCHPRIFPKRGIEMTMKDLKKGKYCGACHARRKGVAFWLKACDRCHL